MAAETRKQFSDIFGLVLQGGPDAEGKLHYPPGRLWGIWPAGPGLQERTIYEVLETGRLPIQEHTSRNVLKDVLVGANVGALIYLWGLYISSVHPELLATPLLLAVEGVVAGGTLVGLVRTGWKRMKAQAELVGDILAKRPEIERLQETDRKEYEEDRRQQRLARLKKDFTELLRSKTGIDSDSIALADELASLFLKAREGDPKSMFMVEHLSTTVLPEDEKGKRVLIHELKVKSSIERNSGIREAIALAERYWKVR